MNARRQKFVELYLICLNATKAAEGAGYSRKCADSRGAKLMAEPEVKAAIAAGLAEQSRERQATRERVLELLTLHAEFDLRRCYDAKANLLPPAEWPEDLGKTIGGLKSKEEYGPEGEFEGIAREVKAPDRIKALELLGKHHGLFADVVKHELGPTLEEIVLASMAKRGGK